MVNTVRSHNTEREEEWEAQRVALARETMSMENQRNPWIDPPNPWIDHHDRSMPRAPQPPIQYPNVPAVAHQYPPNVPAQYPQNYANAQNPMGAPNYPYPQNAPYNQNMPQNMGYQGPRNYYPDQQPNYPPYNPMYNAPPQPAQPQEAIHDHVQDWLRRNEPHNQRRGDWDDEIQGDASRPRVLTHSPVIVLRREARNFEVKPHHTSQLPTYQGFSSENCLDFLKEFLAVVSGIYAPELTEEDKNMIFFPSCLKEKAKTWFLSLEPESLRTWEEVHNKFIDEYFPNELTWELRANITGFRQREDEEFHEAYARFKGYVRDCPHHCQTPRMLNTYFFDGLLPQFKLQVENRGLRFKELRPQEAKAIFERMYEQSKEMSVGRSRKYRVNEVGVKEEDPRVEELRKELEILKARINNPGWGHQQNLSYGPSNTNYIAPPQVKNANVNAPAPPHNPPTNIVRPPPMDADNAKFQALDSKINGVTNAQHNADSRIRAMEANLNGRMTSMENKLDGRMTGIETGIKTMMTQFLAELRNISSEKDKVPSQPEQTMAIQVLRSGKVIDNGVGMNSEAEESNENEENTKNPTQGPLSVPLSALTTDNNLPSTDNTCQYPLSAPLSAPSPDKLLHCADNSLQSPRTTLSALLSAPTTDSLPDTTDNSCQYALSALLSAPTTDILLPTTDNSAPTSPKPPIPKRNDPKAPNSISKVINGLHHAEKRYIPGSLKGTIPQRAQDQEITQEIRDSVPFPSRLRPPKENKLFDDMYNLLKDVNVSIPLLELIRTVPTYVKFFKDLIARDKKGMVIEKVRALEEIYAVNKSIVPPKLGDPGSFCITIKLGNGGTARGMLDLGAGINLMPYALYKQLDIGEMSPTDMKLQMADRSIRQPMGVVKNVLVQVDKLFIPADFVILDVGDAKFGGKDQTILLGRPFMATSKAIIDVHEGRITLKAFDQSVTFDMQKLMNTPSPLLDVGYIEEEVIDGTNEEFFRKMPFLDESDDEFGMDDLYENGLMSEDYELEIPPDLEPYGEFEPLDDYLEFDYEEDGMKKPGFTYDGLEEKEDDEPFGTLKDPIVEKERAPHEHVP